MASSDVPPMSEGPPNNGHKTDLRSIYSRRSRCPKGNFRQEKRCNIIPGKVQGSGEVGKTHFHHVIFFILLFIYHITMHANYFSRHSILFPIVAPTIVGPSHDSEHAECYLKSVSKTMQRIAILLYLAIYSC